MDGQDIAICYTLLAWTRAAISLLAQHVIIMVESSPRKYVLVHFIARKHCRAQVAWSTYYPYTPSKRVSLLTSRSALISIDQLNKVI